MRYVSLWFRSDHNIVLRIVLYIANLGRTTMRRPLSGRQIFAYHVEHLVMNSTVACDQFRPIDRMGVAAKIGNVPSGFPHDHCSCSHVPRTEFDFPKAVEASRRDIAKI